LITTAGIDGSEQYVVPVFLQYEFAKPVIALSAFASFSSSAASAAPPAAIDGSLALR